MKLLFTIAGLQPEYGGPSTSVPALACALAQVGVAVDLVTCQSSPGHAPPRLPPAALVSTRLVPPANRKTRWRSAGNAFAQCLSTPAPGAAYSVVHDHGLWLPNNHAVAVASRNLGLPRVVSPRGMLTVWSMQHKGWKKQFAWWLYQRRDLRSARLLHATSLDEAEAFRALGLSQPIAIIPNGVELPPFEVAASEAPPPISHLPTSRNAPLPPSPISDLQSSRGTRTLLFLSRIHPKKGLLDLVKAWAIISGQWSAVSGQSRVVAPQWRVIIAGGDEGGHAEELKGEIRKLKLETDFEFAGPVQGDAKWNLYRQADLFVLPSHSENFGIVIAEALACGVPAITTRGTPWEGLIAHRCGWWTETGSGPLAAALREAMALDDAARREMGLRGRAWMEQDFSWQSVAEKMKTVYEWMLGGGVKPECVVWVRNIDH